MNRSPLAFFQADLAELERQARLRSLAPRDGVDFASNDYLGLANSPRLAKAVAAAIERGVPVGSGGSRLLRGNHSEHEALEAQAARFFRAQACLYFGSGYSANVALLSTLPQRGDLLVYDELIHASSHEGRRLGRAGAQAVRHGDPQAFSDAIRAWRQSGGKGVVWMAVESLYSMDGDRAPLDDLLAIADANDGVLIIDEAHATGVFGRQGRGLADRFEGRDNVITLHTCGKALGASGALALGARTYIDFLVNRARPFIFATAPSPLMAAAVAESLNILAEEPERRSALAARIETAERGLARFGLPASDSQIIPVILGSVERTMAVAARLREAGFDCRPIRPPTVPEGASRLRVSLTLNVDIADVEALTSAIGGALAA